MNFGQVFTFELVLVALLVLGAIAGALYLASVKRRGGERVDSSEGLSGSSEQRAAIDPHEFYKRTSLENDEDMKMHLYSVGEYEREFGGNLRAQGSGRFVAALKSYRPVGDEWYVLQPERAARVLDLSSEDYEVDGEHGVLLLRKLPHGLPIEARDLL
ncbi:hypothetical protein GBA65_17760 [Rubrobacter marinus]|uniref:Uncharacterized protein n=1 Tax=Rubrobacter marinus TaxID=2653852 RepID=A0A6G8Q0Q7_9ACTN|nr:hypothetical protein [Rubrobacter marinus]QIN80061.1 hypothetical protein GBA65_17760 [Rubrobacter marinus]